MDPIPREYIDNYSDALNRVAGNAVAGLSAALERVDLSGDPAAVREAVIAIMNQACTASTDVAAVLAAEFYDGLRELQVGERLGAHAYSRREREATEGAVRGFVQDLVDGKPHDRFVGKCLDRIDYETRLAASKCMEHNAKRDKRKPKWARVPIGFETCQFCIMLASRGFVYHTEETASHAHPHCDCRVIPSWDRENPRVEGYDPSYYSDVLEGMEKCTIPPAKISKYCLAEENKAKAFHDYLGFGPDDAAELTQKIFAVAGKEDPIHLDETEWGERYYHDVILEGKDGKTARVKIGWIKRPGADKLQLTTAFVKE